MTTTRLRLVVREETNPETVGAGRVDVIRKRLSADEVTPSGIRFLPPDEEYPDGRIQQTYDGGETWIDNPGIDPRHATIYQFPPRGSAGDTTRCDAAANLAGALHSTIDILIAAPDVISAINSWLSYVARFMPEVGFIITILQYIYDLLATLKPYLEDAFTTEVYDGIQCFMYCRMDSSGVLTAAALGDLIGDICGAYEETVCTVCQAILQTWWSEVGCTNAAAIGTLTGDCGDCACGWCFHFDFTASDGGFAAYVSGAGTYGTWVSGTGWRSAYFAAPAYSNVQAAIICRSFTATNLTSYTWEVTYLNNTAPEASLYSDCALTEFVQTGLGWSGDEAWDALQLYAQEINCTSTQYVIITGLTIYGYGDCPFGEPNCD